MKLSYREAGGTASMGNPYRKAYADALEGLIARRQKFVDVERAAYISPEKLRMNTEKYRTDFVHMLGWPLHEYAAGPLKHVRTVHVADTEEAEIYRLQIEPLPDVPFYGILFIPKLKDGRERIPLVISQHGGQGTPELCSSLVGSSDNYNEMTLRLLSRGAAVFAPQLLLWDTEACGIPHERQKTDVRLKQVGGSLAALEITCIRACIDYLCASFPLVDEARIGMAGLSYGGFYTLFTAAAEPRIKAVYSSCFFNSRYAYPWSDWVWPNSGSRFLDAEVAALVAPRALYLEVADADELFSPQGAVTEYERLAAYYQSQDAAEKLRFQVFKGVHEFNPGDDGIDFLFAHL